MPELTELDVSVFGPNAVQSGCECLVQVVVHHPDQHVTASELAKRNDQDAVLRGQHSLLEQVAHGQRVEVLLEARGLEIDEKRQTLIWRGKACSCQFRIAVPPLWADRLYQLRVLVLVNSVPVGSVAFALKATAQEAKGSEMEARGQFRRYTYVFLSYASPDRAEVIKRAQMLRAMGIDFFSDLLSLEPGEHWLPRLYARDRPLRRFLLVLVLQSKGLILGHQRDRVCARTMCRVG